MDHGRFATLTREFASSRSRRGVSAALFGAFVLLFGRALSSGETERGVADNRRDDDKNADAEGKRTGGRPGGKRHGRNRGNGRHRRRRHGKRKGGKPSPPMATPVAREDFLELT